MTDIDEAFEDESKDDTEKVETEEEVKGETETEEETEESKEAEEETKEKETAPPAEDDKPKLVPIAALHDERRKREEAQKELEKVSALIPKTDEEPDMYEDAEAWKDWNTNKVLSEQRIEQEKVTRERLDKSRSDLLEQKSDYDEMERIFELMTMRDPSLVSKMLASDNPAQYAYEQATTYKTSLLGETKEDKPSETDARNAAAIDAVNLVNATAQDSNTPKAEKEETVEELFEDQAY